MSESNRQFQSTILKETEQELMIRLLMLSIEIDRKDNIIRQLLELASGEESRHHIQQLQLHCSKFQAQNKALNQTIKMLKQSLQTIQSRKRQETYTSHTHLKHINEDLQAKVKHLQMVLKRTQQQKIQLQQKVKQNNLKQSMVSFQLLKNQQSQKSKIRELQSLLITERSRAETDRRTLNEKNLLIQQMKNRINQLQNKQRIIISQYQERIKTVRTQLMYHQSLKKSQISSNQQRLNITAQQLNNISQQNKTLKINIQIVKQNLLTKQKQLNNVITQFKSTQARLLKSQNQLKDAILKIQARDHELRVKQKQCIQRDNVSRKLNGQSSDLKLALQHRSQQLSVLQQQLHRVREQLSKSYGQIDDYKQQIRKLKRKPVGQLLCQGCKARQSASMSTIGSQKIIKGLHLGQIIQQAQQLIYSNKKIESLITRHQQTLQHQMIRHL